MKIFDNMVEFGVKKGFIVSLIFIFFTFLIFFSPRFFHLLDLKWLDLLQRIKPDRNSNKVVIVEIDDSSIEKYGRFPFNRAILAELIDKISKRGPAVIGLDLWFPETSSSDETLASSIFYAGNVVGSVFVSEEDRSSTNIEELDYFPSTNSTSQEEIKSFIGNNSTIASNFISRGHLHFNSDFDGLVRHYHPFFIYEKKMIWGLAFEVYRIYKGLDYDKINLIKKKIFIDKEPIPVDDKYIYSIHYLKTTGVIDYIKMKDIMDESKKFNIKDKIVLIGVTATGLHDYRPSPISPSMPGVEIEATVVNNFITANFITPFSFSSNIISFLIMILLGIFYLRINKKFNYIKSFVSITMVIILFALLHIVLFPKFVLLFIVPLLFFLFLFAYLLSYYYLVSSKDARLLSHYLPKNVMHVLLGNPQMVKLGGEKTKVAIIFGDIAGFTTYSEGHSPEEVVSKLNDILSILTEKVFALNGTLDKYIGDCIMAFWGAPIADEKACDHAVESTLQMLKGLEYYDETNNENFKLGVGINFGEAVIGNMGSKSVYDYTAMGDTVNTASRLEGVTRNVNNKLVISKATYDELSPNYQELFEVHDEKISVKGKKEKLTVYKLKNAPLK
ncbi:adenylate/guanylate cyclase domain-containing protein [bacterium]|nr:adenylate/guanylate cyclase domain-containing protein [bacterium]